MASSSKRRNYKFGMAIDLDKCTGCASCMVACMSENNVSFRSDESDKLKSITWIRVYRLSNQKPMPETEICYLPRPCMHCGGRDTGHSPCISVCPVTATDYETSTGIVSQIYSRCIGCRYCMVACPYHARYFNWWDPIWPEGMEQMLNPAVSPRMRGVVEKCSFCYHRYQSAMDRSYLNGSREISEQAYQPACTEVCPSGAITFGDLNNTQHKIHQLVKPDLAAQGKPQNPEAFRLLERLGTNPSVYYLSKREWVRAMGDNYLHGEEVKRTDIEQNKQ